MKKTLEDNMRRAGFKPHDVAGYQKWRNRQKKNRFRQKLNENNDRGTGSGENITKTTVGLPVPCPTTTLSVEAPTSLFPESKSLTEAARARGIEDATLTNPFLEYAREWTNWDDLKIARQFELCRSSAINRAAGLPRSLWAYWQAWCQRGNELEEQRNPFARDLEDHQRNMANLKELKRRAYNGQMRPADSDGMCGPNNGAVRETNRVGLESENTGNANVVRATFGTGSQERDKYGYPKVQKASNGGAPYRITDGRR